MTDLNKEQLDLLFKMAEIQIPEKIDTDDISRALIEIEKKISVCSYAVSKINSNYSPNILIIDDLELSIHQLCLLLSKSGYNIHIARSVEEAVQQYKKNNFDYVLIDLFLPESEDGLNLIGYINSSEKTAVNNTKILVISGTDDTSLIKKCFVEGADEFIGKSPKWHVDILHYIRQSENKRLKIDSDLETRIENKDRKIISITVKNLNKPNVLNEMEKEFVAQANSGYSNIILDMKNIKNIDTNQTAVLVTGYKSCIENNGFFCMCNVSPAVNEALSFVFLDNIIKTFADKSEAINFYLKNPVK